MNSSNKSLRIRTDIGEDKYISVNLDSDYDTLEVLSLKINQKGAYRYHVSTYGVVVGRVLANNGFGVPNAKLSLFIARDENSDVLEMALYPYMTVGDKNSEGIRYNLLSSSQKNDCHQVVGTFPSKRMLLDNESVIEVFDKYYKYTTRTNESGDYMFFGIPVGLYTLHMDLDISDCGKLSQRPRDFLYKGYSIEQFENPNQFKIDTELSALPQIFTQNITVNVKPFWGDSKEGTDIGITRQDIDVQYKFEPTCVFMGSIISDTPNEGISKRCVPTNRMGDMREMVTGEGTIEIVRKTVDNGIEELQIQGKELIDGNGVWCFQIPMNLDYIMTDEYGNTVPSDDPNKGIPTRCEVRFRMSMHEAQNATLQYNRGKVLIPNNPEGNEVDYEFGTKTKNESFRSLMWNGVYSVKSFIPRFQKANNITTNRFTGIKNVNIHGGNNPVPYNNIRIKLPFMFWLSCNIVKLFIRIINIINTLKRHLMSATLNLVSLPYSYIGNELCPDLEYWYFAPGLAEKEPNKTWWEKLKEFLGAPDQSCKKWQHESVCLTYKDIVNSIIDNNDEDSDSLSPKDGQSTETNNSLKNDDVIIKLTPDVDYLMHCVEMNLAQEYEIVKFDFYNDWINGVIYLPRWARSVKYKRKRKKGKKVIEEKVKGCIGDYKKSRISRRYIQQCSLSYDDNMKITNNIGCTTLDNGKLRCHKRNGADTIEILGKNGGIVQDKVTMLGDYVYYMKPKEGNVLLFATDIIMLGTLFDCNEYGIPSSFDSLVSTTYNMPTNLALTNVDNESYSYVNTEYADESNKNDLSTIKNIENWNCGDTCSLKYISKGVDKKIPSQDELMEMLREENGAIDENEMRPLEYEDIFPVTEVSGVDWGYRGPSQKENSDDKLFSPGGHFMGLACGNAETNIKSCVNLKRACEIGVTLSERFDIPVGYDGDETRYLYVSPNGLISKDQVVDVTYRSMFATMNQNSLKTKTDDVTKHKKYDFEYLLPDSFDGSLSKIIDKKYNNLYNTKIEMETDAVFDDDIPMESGNTVHRTYETKSDDYIKFRYGKKPVFLKTGKRMPVYKNSFYFYFGLNEGFTALDKFRKQFYASCAKSTIVNKEPNFEYKVSRTKRILTYDLLATTYNLKYPVEYSLSSDNSSKQGRILNDGDFVIKDIIMDSYVLKITDSNNNEVVKTINIGINEFKVHYDVTTIVDYKLKEERKTLEEFANDKSNGGYINGTFRVQDFKMPTSKLKTRIKHGSIEVTQDDENWKKLFDARTQNFYCFGPGEYEVYITDGELGVLYGVFNVKDGVAPPDIYIRDIKYNDSDIKNVSTLEEAKNLNYNEYCAIVSTKKLGTPFSLDFSCKNSEISSSYVSFYAGKPENFNKNNNIGEFDDNVVLSINTSENYALDFANIYLPSDYANSENIQRGKFYYTAYNKANKEFLTETNEIFNSNGKIVFDGIEDGYYLVTDNNGYELTKGTNGDKYLSVKNLTVDKCYVTKMVDAPVFIYPFAFRCVAIVDKYDDVFKCIYELKEASQAYDLTISHEKDTLFIGDSSETLANKKEYKIELRESNLKYIFNGNKCIFRISNINEDSLLYTSYFLCDNNSELMFSYDETFNEKPYTIETYEQYLKTSDEMELKTDETEGYVYAEIVKDLEDIKGKTFWSFGKVVKDEGDYNDENYMLNDYCECVMLRQSQNKITFQNNTTVCLKGVEIVDGHNLNYSENYGLVWIERAHLKIESKSDELYSDIVLYDKIFEFTELTGVTVNGFEVLFSDNEKYLLTIEGISELQYAEPYIIINDKDNKELFSFANGQSIEVTYEDLKDNIKYIIFGGKIIK